MGAKAKPETFPIQILALAQITVDHELQSRVATSITYQREFSEAMLRGDVFPPVTVFFDGQTYWLADGFHRHGAALAAAKLNPNYRGIRAEVREGTRQDAIAFSAGANQKFAIPRTPADVQKAVRMLLALPEWFNASSHVISRHVGCSSPTVIRVRAAYCREQGVKPPETVKGADGRKKPAKKSTDDTINIIVSDGARVEVKAGEIQSEFEERRSNLHPQALASYFVHRGLAFRGAAFRPGRFPGLAAYHGHGVVYVPGEFSRSEVGPRSGPGSVPATVGRLLLARAHIDPAARAVIVCYKADAPPALVELAERLGVEFLTPDELVASVKAPAGGDATPPTPDPAGPAAPPP